MGPKVQKSAPVGETPGLTEASNTTGSKNTNTYPGNTQRGGKRELESPGETRAEKALNQQDTPEGMKSGCPGESGTRRGDDVGTYHSSEAADLEEAVNKMGDIKVRSETASEVDFTGVEGAASDLWIIDTEDNKVKPIDSTKTYAEKAKGPKFPFQVQCYQRGPDDTTTPMSWEVYKNLEAVLGVKIRTLVTSPNYNFYLAIGAKNHVNGKMLFGCHNIETVNWLETTLEEINIDGWTFTCKRPIKYKGHKMSFYIRQEDGLDKGEVIDLLKNQNKLTGEIFSVVKVATTTTTDRQTQNINTGFEFVLDVSDEFKSSVQSRGCRLHLICQEVEARFPDKAKVTAAKRPYSLPTVEEFKELPKQKRRKLRKMAGKMGKPDLYPLLDPVGRPQVEKDVVVESNQGVQTEAVADKAAAEAVPSSSDEASKVLTGEEFRKEQERQKQEANKAKNAKKDKLKAKSNANDKNKPQPPGQADIRKHFSNKESV
jgi:hypothetical protein